MYRVICDSMGRSFDGSLDCKRLSDLLNEIFFS